MNQPIETKEKLAIVSDLTKLAIEHGLISKLTECSDLPEAREQVKNQAELVSIFFKTLYDTIDS